MSIVSKQYFFIKPCMFCDHGEAELIRYDKKSYGIKCKNCGMEYNKAVDSSAEEIVKGWNSKMETLQSLDNIGKLSRSKTEEMKQEQEIYSLVLYHQFVTKDGKTINIEEPIVTKYVMDRKYNCGTAVVINEMIKKLGDYIISRFK